MSNQARGARKAKPLFCRPAFDVAAPQGEPASRQLTTAPPLLAAPVQNPLCAKRRACARVLHRFGPWITAMPGQKKAPRESVALNCSSDSEG